MFVPWCMNERTTGFTIAISIAAINDQVLSLTNTPSKINKINNSKFKRDLSSGLARSTIECVIFTTLVKCAHCDQKMTHNIMVQPRLIVNSRSSQISIFKKNMQFKENMQYQYLFVEVPFYLSTTAFSTPEMNTTKGTMQSNADCTEVEYRKLPLTGQSPLNSQYL